MGNADVIAVWIHPRSHRNAVEGKRDDAVVIRLTALRLVLEDWME
jgi:hypothetical protein